MDHPPADDINHASRTRVRDRRLSLHTVSTVAHQLTETLDMIMQAIPEIDGAATRQAGDVSQQDRHPANARSVTGLP